MEFKDRLKQLRRENKMTQSKLAEKLDYGYTAIANYESGKNQPSIGVLIKIADIFQVSLDYLLGVTNIRQAFNEETETEEYLEFYQYYSMLNKHGKNELLLYTQWLIERQQLPNDIFYDLPEKKQPSSLFMVAQEQDEYEPK